MSTWTFPFSVTAQLLKVFVLVEVAEAVDPGLAGTGPRALIVFPETKATFTTSPSKMTAVSSSVTK